MVIPLARQTKNILIMDQDHEAESLLVSCLTEADFQVICTFDVDEALRRIQEGSVHLIIADLDVAGTETLKFLESITKRFPTFPVIVISHPGIEDKTMDAFKLGIAEYLMKPLRPHVAVLSVHNALDRARLRRENLKYREQLEQANRELQARLEEIQADQQAGRLIQQKMLPPSPSYLFGYRLEHFIQPANYLAGDFVDYHQVSDSKIVFFLSDVTGHGAASAFVTVLMKQLSTRSRKHYSRDHRHEVKSAAWMLGWINQNVLEAELDRHVTIFLGVIDREKNTLNYSYGGHFPQAIFSTPQETYFLDGRGFPVGLFEGVEYEDHYLELPDQFDITLFSDGILEILPQKDLASKEAFLLETVGRGDNRVETLVKSLGIRATKHFPDDISILTLHSDSTHEQR
ncbi:MAG: SpoIIE family protein phosphatase [Pseudomonadales bacterium]|nr:SpoIIE family protein phosphatase [Pseudomonadales bacterium]